MQAPDPVAVSLFGIDIMWYGVLIACAMGAAIIICCYRGPIHGINSDKVLNFCIIAIPAGVIGARLYYVAFNWENYSGDLIKIFYTRGGGLAIHGGLIFAFLAVLILCKIWKERPLNILDLAIPTIALAQAIGRWGNFFNSEAHGGLTDLPWAINVDGVMVHPTFLYESIWCFLLFFFLLFVDNRRKFEGQPFLLYCILYSVERFFVEGLRTDSLMVFGTIRQAQLFSAIVFAAAIVGYIYLNKKSGRQGFLSAEGKDTKINHKKIGIKSKSKKETEKE